MSTLHNQLEEGFAPTPSQIVGDACDYLVRFDSMSAEDQDLMSPFGFRAHLRKVLSLLPTVERGVSSTPSGSLPTLYVMSGLPYSGKSTYASTLELPIVCPDSIRLAMHGQKFYPDAEPLVWAHAQLMVRSLILSGHTQIVIDACNATSYRRRTWEKATEWNTHFLHIKTSLDECLRRAYAAQDDEIVSVIHRMHGNWEPFTDTQVFTVIDEPRLTSVEIAPSNPGRLRSLPDDELPPNHTALLILDALAGS